MLNDLINVINRYSPRQEEMDTWWWEPSPDGRYCTKKAYDWLVQHEVGGDLEESETFSLVWNKLSPPKVNVHVWRVLHNKLPTRSNLRRRNIIPDSGGCRCVFYDNDMENMKHVLFECPFSYGIWMSCCKWLGVETAFPSDTSMNLLLFSSFFRSSNGKKFAVSIWECVVWSLWKLRNARIFRNEEINGDKLLKEIKTRLWSWFANKEPRLQLFTYSHWICNPRMLIRG